MRRDPTRTDAAQEEVPARDPEERDDARVRFAHDVARRLEELRALHDLARYLHRAKLPR